MLKKLIFPTGKCHPKYVQYISWSFLSNIISSTLDTLGTHCTLSVIGSIDNNVIASYNYIGKNLLGQIGSLYYILNAGSNIDKNPRKYLNTSIILNSTSIYIECITPLLPVNSFLFVAGSANLLKNISWTSYGSVNAKIIQTLSIDNNISEIYSKINVLNTISSSIGMCVGLGLTAKIPDNNVRLSIIPILTFLRWYTLNKAIKDLI
jgi:hypothetical protein